MTTAHIPIPRRARIDNEPLMVMLHRWYLESRTALQDLLGLVVLGGGTFAFLITHDFTELFFDYTRQFEHLQMDEMLFTGIFVLAIFVPGFALRRWADAIRFLRQSNTDSLTKLANRRRGWKVLSDEMARAKRYHTPLSIIIFDIDQFKQVNDQHGHLKGDHVLEELAKSLTEKIRPSDTLVRWGGEEFLVVLTDTDREGGLRMAERLRRCVESECQYNAVRVTASFGVAQWKGGQAIDAFIQQADNKLYDAKANGRNRVE